MMAAASADPDWVPDKQEENTDMENGGRARNRRKRRRVQRQEKRSPRSRFDRVRPFTPRAGRLSRGAAHTFTPVPDNSIKYNYPREEDDGVRGIAKHATIYEVRPAFSLKVKVKSRYAEVHKGRKRMLEAHGERSRARRAHTTIVNILYGIDTQDERLWIKAESLNRGMASNASNAFGRLVKPALRMCPWLVRKMRVNGSSQSAWWVRSSRSLLSDLVAIRKNCTCELRQRAILQLRDILLLDNSLEENLLPPPMAIVIAQAKEDVELKTTAHPNCKKEDSGNEGGEISTTSRVNYTRASVVEEEKCGVTKTDYRYEGMAVKGEEKEEKTEPFFSPLNMYNEYAANFTTEGVSATTEYVSSDRSISEAIENKLSLTFDLPETDLGWLDIPPYIPLDATYTSLENYRCPSPLPFL